jgi:glycerol-3-phosphate dehydrogenase (NAD(P)+)
VKTKIAVIGDGGWGTALALVLSRNGHAVEVWSPDAAYAEEMNRSRRNPKFLPCVHLDEALHFSADCEAVLAGAAAAFIVSPSAFVKSVLARFAPYVPDGLPAVSATKGFDPAPPHARITELVAAAWPKARIAALSGPSIAPETARGVPTAVTIASADAETARFFQALVTSDTFRAYTTDDVIGLELGGALKNVIALAGGIADGLGYGANAKAALITRGMAEMTRLGVALGARRETFYGLAGIGDLIVTCSSQSSRNRTVGERLGKGEKIDEILGGMVQVAEGVCTARPAMELARATGVETPIMSAVSAILAGEMTAKEAVLSLMRREAKDERECL